MQYRRNPQQWAASINCHEQSSCPSSAFSSIGAAASRATTGSGRTRVIRTAIIRAHATFYPTRHHYTAGASGRTCTALFLCTSACAPGSDCTACATGSACHASSS